MSSLVSSCAAKPLPLARVGDVAVCSTRGGRLQVGPAEYMCIWPSLLGSGHVGTRYQPDRLPLLEIVLLLEG